mmetsp:Transcript_2013/g.5684  ORF Transcript_2013/g.5684 Transcript_2013/m.5684 type:complete len:211 (+) Transcript_2013:424-1056(+)
MRRSRVHRGREARAVFAGRMGGAVEHVFLAGAVRRAFELPRMAVLLVRCLACAWLDRDAGIGCERRHDEDVGRRPGRVAVPSSSEGSDLCADMGDAYIGDLLQRFRSAVAIRVEHLLCGTRAASLHQGRPGTCPELRRDAGADCHRVSRCCARHSRVVPPEGLDRAHHEQDRRGSRQSYNRHDRECRSLVPGVAAATRPHSPRFVLSVLV